MLLGNYCKKCGCRILPNEPYCSKCGLKTGYTLSDGGVFIPPIHNIGFFNFDIDFSPYIESKREDFKYEICACGYLNDVNNDYCYMCGTKRSESKLQRLLKNKSKPEFSLDNVLCECGAINSKENVFCEMCGRQLHEENIVPLDNYSNFNLQFKDSKFCFCGEENDRFSLFCKNCGLPLVNYGRMQDISILCACSKINEITSDFCIECGTSLKDENTLLICVCGEKNPENAKFCQSCDRPLNPKRNIKSKIICSCGQILDWNTDFCQNCGKNIRKLLINKNSISGTGRTLKSRFR
ncbi:double zinc ribbon domain-containing protein [Methanobrevibacter sp.]|uniref:double zinc ribbon domain-containing protein n=1 Tax=Methanobrevibacter sp. TaxID=66852 RepID=UPI00389008D4